MYLMGTGIVCATIVGFIYVTFIYERPTCFDGWKNGQELGKDCGGVCARACLVDVEPPIVRFTQAFRISPGMYNAVAYVENRNVTVGVKALKYKFVFYGDNDRVLTTVGGTTTLPPDNVYAIFEKRINLNGIDATRVALEIDSDAVWERMEDGRERFAVQSTLLKSADFEPRLEATILNQSLENAELVEAVATIFDAQGNPLTTSEITIPEIPGGASKRVTFTWPEPIAKTLRTCAVPSDVMLAIDLSGSINDDGGTPPEPLATVLRAARGFANRLRTGDQAGIVTFATNASVESTLMSNTEEISTRIAQLSVKPADERGSTNIGDGLKEAIIELLSPRHNPDARKVVVLLTDGKANAPILEGEDLAPEDYALAVAEEGKKRGVEIFAIGLGKGVNGAFIDALASNPASGYLAIDSSTLDGIYTSISSSICEEGAAVIDIIPKIDLSR